MKFDYVAFCRRHYAVPLLIAVALATVGFFGAKRISLDPSTTSLLPEDTPTLAALEELERRVPGASRAYFLVQSSDPAFNVRATARIKEEVEKWEETRWALDRRDPQALLERRLQLLPLAELERLADDVETIVDWEECKRLPGCTNFEARPEIPKEEELDARFMAVPEVSSLVRYIGRTSIFDKKGETSRPAALPDGALCNADGTTCAVEVSLDGSASNLAFATKIFERGEALLASLEFEDAPADLQTAFTGNYRSAPMTKRIMERDLSVTSWISTIAVVLWLILQFRGFRPLILLVLPLGVSVLVTLGLVGALGMELNLVSAFTFAILIGVGVDFGVHLLMHYGDFRRRGVPVFEAIRSASRELRVSMITAASTTAFTFGMLAVADFRGLSQLGLIAAVGVFIAMLTYRALIPPLVVALDRIVPEKASLLRTLSWIKSDVLGPAGAKVLAISFVALALGFGLHAKDVEFEYDFQRLNPPETQHGMSQGETLHGASGVPIYVLAGDVTEATRVASTVERELVEMGFAPADRVLSLSLASFLPPDVDARVAEVRRMREALDRIWDRISEADRARFARLRDLLETEDPITLESLPPYVRDAFVERDGTAGAFAVVYVRVSGSDAILMEELSGIIQGFRERFPGVRFAAPKAVVGEIMPSLRADGPIVLGISIVGLFLFTLLASRSLRRSLLIVTPVVLASAFSLGLLALFDIRINFYNMLILPVSYGLGIDGAIYVAWAMEESKGDAEEREAALATARRGILASMMTTVGAFASFVFAKSPGLASLGEVAIILLGMMLCATVLWLPSLYKSKLLSRVEPVEGST